MELKFRDSQFANVLYHCKSLKVIGGGRDNCVSKCQVEVYRERKRLGSFQRDGHQHFALKWMYLTDPDQINSGMQGKTEAQRLLQLSHRNLVKMYATGPVDDSPIHAFLMEYCQGGDLHQVSKLRIDEPAIQSFARQILQGLQYLHAHQIIHRDLKGHNIFLSSLDHATCVAKIGDVNDIKRLMPDDGTLNKLSSRWTGTFAFMSPEMINRTINDASYDKTDIWSFGCVLIEMVIGKFPTFFTIQQGVEVELKEYLRIIYYVGQGNHAVIPSTWPSSFQDLLQQCLQVDPLNRPSASDLLCHPFFTEDPQEWSFDGPFLLPWTMGEANIADEANRRPAISVDNETLQVVDYGSFGMTYQGQRKGQPDVDLAVIKVHFLRDYQDTLIDLFCQAVLTLPLKHDNIIRHLHYDLPSLQEFNIEALDNCHILTEFCRGGSLQMAVQYRIDERLQQKYARQILEGLIYLHDQHIVHYNLKSSSILLDRPDRQTCILKIAGFNRARKVSVDHEEPSAFFADAEDQYSPFISPKRKSRTVFLDLPNKEALLLGYSDIWSFGCVLMQLICGEIKQDGQGRPFISPKWPETVQNILGLCLDQDPTARPPARQLLDHPFFTDTETASWDFADTRPEYIEGRQQGGAADKASLLTRKHMHSCPTNAQTPSQKKHASRRGLRGFFFNKNKS